MRVAVIGAGLAGVAFSWHLLQRPGFSVDLFDPKGVAGGASGMASGLLHPCPGKKAEPSWRSDEGMAATRELVRVSEQALGRPVASATGILRPAVSEQQQIDFKKRGIWWEAEEVERRVPHAASFPGLWIPEGMTIFCSLYLQGLWKACEHLGAKWIAEKVTSLEALGEYDAILVATGCETFGFSQCRHLPLKATRGRILTCRWKEPLEFSLVSLKHIALTEEADLCRIGATYERGDVDEKEEILGLKRKVALFYPPAMHLEEVDVKVGTRISPKEGYRPIVEKIGENIWVFTGLGSRGMLYHALLAKEIAWSL